MPFCSMSSSKECCRKKKSQVSCGIDSMRKHSSFNNNDCKYTSVLSFCPGRVCSWRSLCLAPPHPLKIPRSTLTAKYHRLHKHSTTQHSVAILFPKEEKNCKSSIIVDIYGVDSKGELSVQVAKVIDECQSNQDSCHDW